MFGLNSMKDGGGDVTNYLPEAKIVKMGEGHLIC